VFVGGGGDVEFLGVPPGQAFSGSGINQRDTQSRTEFASLGSYRGRNNCCPTTESQRHRDSQRREPVILSLDRVASDSLVTIRARNGSVLSRHQRPRCRGSTVCGSVLSRHQRLRRPALSVIT
jgi:hypothetical protein